jgi:hypothetical protein
VLCGERLAPEETRTKENPRRYQTACALQLLLILAGLFLCAGKK